MKSLFTSVAAGSLIAALATAQPPSPRYNVTDLGTLPGGNFSQATYVSNNDSVSGLSTVADGTQHAVVWYQGRIIDISKPGLLGPNTGAFGINVSGQAAVEGEIPSKDPNNENFCDYGTGLRCLPFLWQGGLMTPLPTLGGPNAGVGQINNRGQIPGIAETGTRDSECPPGVAFTGTGPQVLDYEAVIWGPRQGEIRVLSPLPGDTVGMALWDNDGSVHDLGNLGGGTGNALLGLGNIALAINNQGQVVGASVLPGNAPDHAFLWTRETGKMQDLGTLPGDVSSGGVALNDRGEVVGASFDKDGNPRAYLWRSGVMTDLNTLVPADSPLYLLFATAINSRGDIVGFGVTGTGDVHGFLATPRNLSPSQPFPPAAKAVTRRVVLSEDARRQLQQRLPFGRFGAR